MSPPDLRTVRQDLEQVTQELQDVLGVSPYERDYDRGFELRERQRELKERAQELEEQWKRARGNARTVVSEDDIAEVVSIWTGVPVRKLTTDETTRLLTMEKHLHQRVIGQEEGDQRRGARRAPRTRGTERSQTPDRLVHLSRPHRGGEDGVGARAGGIPLRQ